MKRIGIVLPWLFGACLTGCGDTALLSVDDGSGTSPQLPAPHKTLLPTVNIAPAVGWPGGAKPKAATGLQVVAFADKLDHPRWLYVLPNGDVLVAETNAPPKPDDGKGIRGWIMGKAMQRAGAGVPSANRITLLRDADHDGVAEIRTTFLDGLNSPFGMALVGNEFYVADTDKLLRFHYPPGATQLREHGTQVVALPGGPLNHHWTKNVIASADGKHLYVTVGSNSNVGENGLDQEQGRAAIWDVDAATGAHRLYASGLRNPNGLAWEPRTGRLWTAVNERDEIGSDLVPDYITSVKEGGFYGWPYSYYGPHVDERVQPQDPQKVARALVPDYAVGPHTASLGLAFAQPQTLPAPFDRGAFVGQHGSWNRKPHSGYKVIFVPFDSTGKPVGKPLDLLTGFLDSNGKAMGRPVGVATDPRGGLLVADDVGNVVWRVSKAP
ncbi:sorbosone dehydrogenase family protein [Pseudomonas sp. NC26]|uniref:Sorbosone dehydrogenase family protein n=1 Tax=Pseudomonas putida TaxID=303 RepID=A0A7W2L2Y6_PSEPU|nr:MULTISPECIES: sorbosone dehydrogenase family protein [Pseudomonas]MBA6117405.1 sorbosone dehydrogenase family protein [Pseudomonas putida]MCZ9636358.1 sorbosone dehydrogenase family protein [Pseudomonas putida]MEC4876076.1 sorbosone dehydrogenase family protein [Pseudomonas sp. NC26]QNL89398.1 L-sorbosone dehydrogenase [Pseudomonas putida]